jgi:hypothetical protein
MFINFFFEGVSMMSTKQVVLALLVSVQIASAADAVEQVSFFSNFLKSGTEVANTCMTVACANRNAIIAVAAVSAVSAAAYYNWDRVQNAYNRAVAYVKENQETNAKIGGAVLGATSVVVGAAYMIKSYFFAATQEIATEQVEQKEENKNEEVAPTTSEDIEKKK